jgi:diacylglycerol kinase family enzyme
MRASLPRAPRPLQPVLFYNPASGGGKAARFGLAAEAKARGIEPVEITPGEDIEGRVRDAVSRGADALAMAGGDGSQAIVASVASEHSLPYACVPAGTRNHFALDLGVDRDDVVGALDAFVRGVERIVDLADVNGRVFVNNVSLGIYGEAVNQPGYRDAKLRTLLETIPEALAWQSPEAELRWTEPDGESRTGRPTMLVSNDPYRFDIHIGSALRPRLDEGLLGIAILGGPPRSLRHSTPSPRRREWTAPSFAVEAEAPVFSGIDGEAATLAPPLRFQARPGALRVRIALGHPGADGSQTVARR